MLGTFIKESIITKLQKSPCYFWKNVLARAIYHPRAKYSLKGLIIYSHLSVIVFLVTMLFWPLFSPSMPMFSFCINPWFQHKNIASFLLDHAQKTKSKMQKHLGNSFISELHLVRFFFNLHSISEYILTANLLIIEILLQAMKLVQFQKKI